MKKFNKDERRIINIMTLSLLIVPLSVAFLILDLRGWEIFKSENFQTLLDWISMIIGGAIFYWIIIGFLSLSKIFQRNRGLEEEVYKLNKDNAKTIEFSKLKENPDFFRNTYVNYVGKIIKIIEEDSYTQIFISVTKDEHGYQSKNQIYVECNWYTNFEAGDVISVYGKIHGSVNAKYTNGDVFSLPGVLAEEIKLQK
ncbi:hypothetical protein MPH47_09790 [Psychrobacillus psychrodurans]|uniref:hypothetical protein n=1 Tax=Psychrobacillus psychrodurans TaxID=126157 RepID=UPI001F4EC200|nr:hypothetical protein [Psychrobacillus psychrodurans]MCK1997508.1 hypothetical protein [Psychrobacillus psychrodurans]